MVYGLTKKYLTEDDLKVLKHLKAIDNLFKKGDLSISELFADNGTLIVTKMESGIEYEIDCFHCIACDGGDTDRDGRFAIHSADELEDYYDNIEDLIDDGILYR